MKKIGISLVIGLIITIGTYFKVLMNPFEKTFGYIPAFMHGYPFGFYACPVNNEACQVVWGNLLVDVLIWSVFAYLIILAFWIVFGSTKNKSSIKD